MHAYDALAFNTEAGEMIVPSGAQHSMTAAIGAQTDPLWVFDPASQRWRTASLPTETPPNFFAAGAEFDPISKRVYGYGSLASTSPLLAPATEFDLPRGGLWRFDPRTGQWTQLSENTDRISWFNIETLGASRQIAVFGGDNQKDDVLTVNDDGTNWQLVAPTEPTCGGGYYFPAATHAPSGNVLFVPPISNRQMSTTCIADLKNNVTLALPDANLPWVGLNYTMVYATDLDIFVLVTGSFSRGEPTAVHVLRLELESLSDGSP
ncbi:MAG: hypothetical protein AAGC71_15175 [Pseudomonadota bacterium]